MVLGRAEWCFILELEALTEEELLLCSLVFLLLCQLTKHHPSRFAFQFFFACFPAHHNIIMFLFLPARGRYFLLLRQQLHSTTLMNPHKGKMCLWRLFLPWQPKCSSSLFFFLLLTNAVLKCTQPWCFLNISRAAVLGSSLASKY